MAAEEILVRLKTKPICIIGFDSTTLITGKVLFDVPTISVLGLFREKGKYSKHRQCSFVRRFGDVVQCPVEIEEIEIILEALI